MSLRIGKYRLDKTLGKGTFAKVKLGYHEITGYKVAIKILNREAMRAQSGMEAKTKREIQILKQFRHPHIIKLYEVIETPTDIFMVMEYVSGGELFDYIVRHGRLSEDEARKFFQQIIAAVDYFHRHRVVHRDLKPENLLLDGNGRVKVADFGLSNLMRDGDFLKTPCGSPNYAAPEVISGQLYAGAEVDVWSCGVILFALLCARLPFEDAYIPHLFKKIREGIYTFPPHVSNECKQLIGSMLAVDPLKRITVAEIREHPWVKKNLPPHLKKVPPIVTTQSITEIDNNILEELMLHFKLSRQDAINQLQAESESGEGNQLQIAYRLIEGSHDDQTEETNMSPGSGKYLSPGMAALLSTSPPMNLREALPFDELDDAKKRLLPSNEEPVMKQMWKLGITSSLPPQKIMEEIHEILIAHDIEWKNINEYHLHSRSKNPDGPSVKMAIQLFKVKNDKYLLDFKKLSGETFQFFELCSLLRRAFLEIEGSTC